MHVVKNLCQINDLRGSNIAQCSIVDNLNKQLNGFWLNDVLKGVY